MPIYTEAEKSYDEMKKLQSPKYQCGDCGGPLTLCWGGSFGYDCYILRCAVDVNHSKIDRLARLSPADVPGFNLFDAQKKRRKKMEKEYGEEKTHALAKYHMMPVMTREAATEIVETLWPGTPPAVKKKAILLCANYNLNPLMNHVFVLPFKNKKTGSTEHVVVMGIEATRLMSHRKHHYTYLDLTPRKATREELIKILGEENIDKDALYTITKGRDIDTGAEAYGLGAWKGEVYGSEKGNTPFNMSSIRSERQYLKRQYPAEMPSDVGIVDEQFIDATGEGYIEGESRLVDEETGEIIEGEVVEVADQEPEEPKPKAEKTKKQAIKSSKDELTEVQKRLDMYGMGLDDVRSFVAEKGYKVSRLGEFTSEQIAELIQYLDDKFNGKQVEPENEEQQADMKL